MKYLVNKIDRSCQSDGKMVRITEELVRKKAEHNEGIIGTLEELSLHQEDVEKIEHLNNWCKEIQILYLQANLIPKIENLNKLKKLQYLNLALNNIEKIENLERCESLQKLDLTLNFIGDLESVCSLRHNIHLNHLFLTGNPCCDFEGYRQFVIAKLPQLISLDAVEITKSDRIKALQNIGSVERAVAGAQERYKHFRADQVERSKNCANSALSDEEFWKSTSENSPEARVEIARRSRKGKDSGSKDEKPKRQVSLFAKTGRPLNVNQAKLSFVFNDDDPEKFTLDLAVYKYLDTNLIDVDLQPIYVRISIKGKVFQMVFPEEILIDRSTAKRSQTTGHLLLEMPRANYKPMKCRVTKNKPKEENRSNKQNNFLEVSGNNEMDFSKIYENKNDFVNNVEVPPLEYG